MTPFAPPSMQLHEMILSLDIKRYLIFVMIFFRRPSNAGASKSLIQPQTEEAFRALAGSLSVKYCLLMSSFEFFGFFWPLFDLLDSFGIFWNLLESF